MKNNKGNWEFNFFQKKYDPIQEANIKTAMSPSNAFNPKHIHSYNNSFMPKEEVILLKKKNNGKLNSSELVILNNYISKNDKLVKTDILNIQKHGQYAQPITQEGKIRLLFKILETQLIHENVDKIANIYLKLLDEQFKLNTNLQKEYKLLIDNMNNIIDNIDIIELQFTKFHTQIPPLNVMGFTKFDEWQLQVINNIDNEISMVINAPTSAGKSVLSGYAATKGNTLFIVPTDALAWQTSAYIGNILNINVPILTKTFQTIPTRTEMINLMNNSIALVGTPEIIIDYLPFIKNNFKWLIFDEIHMIGKEEGHAMEYIIKLLPNVNLLALSATISNIDEIIIWLTNICNRNIDKIVCDKRFFNLQRYYYSENDILICLHPLALITEEQIKDKSILIKTLLPTPPDCWDLAIKIKNIFEMNELEPYSYFKDIRRVQLYQVNEYFNKLIYMLTQKYETDPLKVMEIINTYKYEELVSYKIDLIKLAYKLKTEHKTPAIFFQHNTESCLKLLRQFAKQLEDMENIKYPHLFSERIKYNKKHEKKIIDTKDDKLVSMKALLGKVQLKRDKYISSIASTKEDDIYIKSLQEPHEEFIFNSSQYFTETMVEEWVAQLKNYFPNNGIYYHYIIKLLWRGVGIYATGLPDPYLRLVQILACNKQLAIVFSDISLVFGISMPFRSVAIIRDDINDNLDTMIYHQMAGRAGRRGLDKEGNVIFVGFSWERIKELSISSPPIITGLIKPIYTLPHANKLSELTTSTYNWDNIYKNHLKGDINNEHIESVDQYKINYNDKWNFAFNSDINHLHMNWKLRHTDECLIISFLIPYLKRGFESLDHTLENNQISIAHFLCHYISLYPATNDDDCLETHTLLSESPYNNIKLQLQELNINIIDKIDNKIFISIRNNQLVNSTDNEQIHKRLFEFGETLKIVQHYCYHSKILGICRLLGKLLTRIWWIYYLSSTIMKPIYEYEAIN